MTIENHERIVSDAVSVFRADYLGADGRIAAGETKVWLIAGLEVVELAPAEARKLAGELLEAAGLVEDNSII